MTERKFSKYTRQGSYHWSMLSRHPRKHHPYVAARYQVCLDMLKPVAGLKVLDFGCGDGALSGLLAKQGAYVTGIDPEETGLTLARQEFEDRGLHGEFVASPKDLPDQAFDRIVCTEVLEHLSDAETVLVQISRLLSPNGIAVISTPIRLAESVRDVEHVREYFPSEFNALCAQHFMIIETRQVLPVGLQEALYIEGVFGRILRWTLFTLSAWFGWNYMLRLKGKYTLFTVQIAKVTCKSSAVKTNTSRTNDNIPRS